MKYTDQEKQAVMDFLRFAEVGSFIEEENRTVTIEDMCGGRFLLYEDGELVELTEWLGRAFNFITFAI